jgi:hypothetical protein
LARWRRLIPESPDCVRGFLSDQKKTPDPGNRRMKMKTTELKNVMNTELQKILAWNQKLESILVDKTGQTLDQFGVLPGTLKQMRESNWTPQMVADFLIMDIQ